ncbi:MAG TPA: hypothetical protein VFT22_39475 [Kofleriaceae bacterium]|nr:hypothetical protein [Kofleriaceae bacterium]
MRHVRLLAALATLLLAAPAFAQPQPDPEAMTGASPSQPRPAPPGAVVIVTPQPLTPMQPAGPGQVAPAPAAPQTDPWSNVSHINGQIVKVGERSDYLYDTGKTTNIASNPIGWMFGFYGVSVSHAVHANVAIRGDFNLFRIGGSKGHELGVSVPIYFRRAFQGPFLEPGVIARNFDDDCDSCDHQETIGPSVVFGWQWSFDSGLNIAMAFGAMRDMNNRSSDTPEPSGYFRIGYLF